MLIIKPLLIVILVIGIIIVALFIGLVISEKRTITLECSSEFWANNLELWSLVGLDYNNDFDSTFGKDYFEQDITLKEAIMKKGVGMDHLARSGTTAYLNALADPEIDEKNIRRAINFGYIHQIDNYLSNCNEVKKEVSFFG